MHWENFVTRRLESDRDQDELLRILNREMFIVAYAKVRNKSDAWDIVQDSWVKILRKIDTLRDQDKLFQWAKTIVSNTAINAMKHKTIKYEVLVSDSLLEYASPMSEKQMDDRVILNELYGELQNLDQETKEILLYKFHYGCKDQWIADKMRLPLGTVKAKIHRRIKRLRKHYTI